MTRKMKNNPASKPDFGFTVAGLIGGVVGLTVTLILVLIAPFLLLNTNDPNSVSNYCAAVCAFIGSGVGSAIALQGKSFAGRAFIGCNRSCSDNPRFPLFARQYQFCELRYYTVFHRSWSFLGFFPYNENKKQPKEEYEACYEATMKLLIFFKLCGIINIYETERSWGI